MFKKASSILIIFLFLCAFATAEDAKTATNEIVWGATVPSAFMLYIVNPDIMAGWPSKLYDYEDKYILDKYKGLPILGSWHNEGGIPDKEMLVKTGVKRAFIIQSSQHAVAEMIAEMEMMGISVIALPGEYLQESIDMLRILGKELGVPERGEQLARFAERAVKRTEEMVKGLKDSERLRVFVSNRPTGLGTNCDVEVLDMLGAINVFECTKNMPQRPMINFEQLIMYDPDAIVITDPMFAAKFKDETKWHRLRAYKEGRVYIMPFGPFGWMDKPAIIRIMAIQWLACEMYPDRCNVDMQAETKEFMKLYMHRDLSDEQINEILYK